MFFQYREYNYKLGFIGSTIVITAAILEATKKADTPVVLPMLIVGCVFLFFSRKRVKRNEDENQGGEINSN